MGTRGSTRRGVADLRLFLHSLIPFPRFPCIYFAAMKAMDKNLSDEVLRWQEKLFKRSIRRQMRLRKIKQLLGAVSSQRCLEVCSGDGVISKQLRLDGGEWTTLVPDARAQAALSYFIKGGLRILQDETLDAPDQSFDAVVVVDMLERMQNDRDFIRECHRVLKPDGRLVISVARRSFLGLLDSSWRKKGLARAGYTATEFFDVLKDGFDVPETISYSTGLIEMPGKICEAIANKLTGGPYNMPPENADTEDFYHYTKIYALGTLVYPLMWLLSKLDHLLLFIAPGRTLAAKTKRRVWRERRTPILIDGRSIAEAALNTKIGTAAPF